MRTKFKTFVKLKLFAVFRIAAAHCEALAEYRAREAAARLNQEPYYSATPVREQGRRTLIARPTAGASAEARPCRSDSVLIEEDYIEMQTREACR